MPHRSALRTLPNRQQSSKSHMVAAAGVAICATAVIVGGALIGEAVADGHETMAAAAVEVVVRTMITRVTFFDPTQVDGADGTTTCYEN
ncbi:hypothetical protein H310_12590 [Aphanomyces invadans]|uniref:Uncharacterized protein n=1 Tax=Aphanomyces invadans TaxID=157072 RepID=A0A024TJ11_9STRA|nr:hypothetical protein H310_12590 [Aphanomyces invadans]ETV93596.1 hypothetical protein H310_12590 [Aphanomyces invadans]|eukprot:XP_008877938.1 hypothetical protein H310_12590 [Aphanomyces invadans]